MSYQLNAQELETLETYNTIAPVYNEKNPAHWADSLFISFLNCLRGPRVIDLGCGTGRTSALVTSYGFQYFGVDISEGMLKVASDSYSSAENVNLVRAKMGELPFLPESMDGFLSIASFIHIPKLKLPLVLENLKICLKPESAGMISVPFGTFEDMFQPDFSEGPVLSVCWEEDKLAAVFRTAGYTIECLSLWGYMIHMIVKRA